MYPLCGDRVKYNRRVLGILSLLKESDSRSNLYWVSKSLFVLHSTKFFFFSRSIILETRLIFTRKKEDFLFTQNNFRLVFILKSFHKKYISYCCFTKELKNIVLYFRSSLLNNTLLSKLCNVRINFT